MQVSISDEAATQGPNLAHRTRELLKVAGCREAAQARIQEEGNRKRSETTKRQPRTEDGKRLASGAPTTSGQTRDRKAERERETATAKANASSTDRGTVDKGDELRPVWVPIKIGRRSVFPPASSASPRATTTAFSIRISMVDPEPT